MICRGGRFARPAEGLEIAARKTEFAEAIQSDLGCPVLSRKNISFPIRLQRWLLLRRSGLPEGRFAIVTDVGHGMWWTRIAARDERR
jgi:hypothetical protein